MYFDDIRAINTSDVEQPDKDNKPGEDNNSNENLPIEPDNNTPNKLPQTDEANSAAIMTFAMSLIGAAISIKRKRK